MIPKHNIHYMILPGSVRRETPHYSNNTREENFESEQVTAEMKALDVLGIKPPTDIRQIKKRYKELVKKYHPDLNREDETAEEKIKQINAAFTVLKIAFEI